MKGDSEKMYTVYKHTLPANVSGKNNDMIYIGITKQNPEKRWQNGKGYQKKNTYFGNAIQKYGWDNFIHEILFNGLTKEQAEEMEIKLIAEYKSNTKEYGYNIANGGNCFGTMAQETKDKISKANMGNQYNLGNKHTESAKRKISESLKGNQHGKGKIMSDSVKRIIAESHRTEDFKKKVSKANTGKRHSYETRMKISESHKGVNAKKVICIETGIIYDSVQEAAKAIGLKGVGHICACCKGTRDKSGGYHWCYEDDYCEDLKNRLLSKVDKHCKSVICIETNKIYDSIAEASLDTGISKTRIGECCSGKCEYAGKSLDKIKFHWEYYKEVS